MRWSTIFKITASALVGMAGSNVVTYAITPELVNINLIQNEAKMVQDYSGPNPQEALDHALERIDILEEDNPSKVEEILGLEQDVVEAKSLLYGIDNKVLYTPVLKQVSTDLASFAQAHTKQVSNLFASGTDLGLAALSGAMAFNEYKKEKGY